MSARKSPAFSFYADSWIGGTLRMSFEEKGIYMELLSDQWVNGGFSKDVAMRVCRGAAEATVDRILEDKFTLCGDGLYRNSRLEEERSKQQKNAEKARENGKKGGRPRKPRKPSHNPDHNPAGNPEETQAITQTITQTQTQNEPRKKLSDSDSDSVLVLELDSGSDSREREPAPALGDGPIVPEQFRTPEFTTVWQAWKGHVHERTHSRLGAHSEELQLKALAERFSVTDAVRVIEFSIVKQAKNLIMDGSHREVSSKANEVLI